MSNLRWNDNLIQFARLIAEIEAAGGFTETLVQDLCTSMDLEKDEVFQLVDRAQSHFDENKDIPVLAELVEEGTEIEGYAIGDGFEGSATEYEWKGRRFILNVWHSGKVEIYEKTDDEEEE